MQTPIADTTAGRKIISGVHTLIFERRSPDEIRQLLEDALIEAATEQHARAEREALLAGTRFEQGYTPKRYAA